MFSGLVLAFFNIEKRLRWLRRNIQNKVNELGSIHFYIWLGTCNLTTKDKSVYISLAFTETNDAIAVITNLFKQFIDLVNPYPNCKLTFLEVPYYSIVRWNTTRGHRQPEVFATQDNTPMNKLRRSTKLYIHWIESKGWSPLYWLYISEQESR
jgi:hypothetical protein